MDDDRDPRFIYDQTGKVAGEKPSYFDEDEDQRVVYVDGEPYRIYHPKAQKALEEAQPLLELQDAIVAAGQGVAEEAE